MRLKRIVSKLLKKYEDGSVSVIDDFLAGHCHEFALALHKVFGYKIGLIKSRYTDKKTGEERKVLLHAFALDSKNQAYDVEGKYNVTDAIKGYSTQKHPEHGEVLKNISYNTYADEKKFKSKLWTIPLNEALVQKAIKKITKSPLTYFDSRNIIKVAPLTFKPLVTNNNWSMKNDLFYNYRQENKVENKITSELKKIFGTIDHKWVIKDTNFVWRGLAISIGLGTYNFDLVDNKVIEIDNNIDDKLSDEESKKNVDEYMKDLTLFVTTSPKIKEWFKKTLKIKDDKKSSIVAKVMKKLSRWTDVPHYAEPDKENRTVLRIQNSKGRGPFDIKDKWKEKENHPDPFSDPKFNSSHEQMISDSQDADEGQFLYGFENEKQLEKYFTPGELKNLAKLGYETEEVEASYVWYGTHQLIFEK